MGMLIIRKFTTDSLTTIAVVAVVVVVAANSFSFRARLSVECPLRNPLPNITRVILNILQLPLRAGI